MNISVCRDYIAKLAEISVGRYALKKVVNDFRSHGAGGRDS